MLRSLLPAAFVGVVLAACGGPPVQVCAPGASVACTGAGGCAGGQVCRADGSGFEACICGGGGFIPGPADAGGADGGASDSGVADAGDSGVSTDDAGSDGGDFDAGSDDAGVDDAGSGDAGPGDAGDAGPSDGGATDAGPTQDGGASDGGALDGGSLDGGSLDGGAADAGDAGAIDAGPIDAGPSCADAADAGSTIGCEFWAQVLDNGVGAFFKGGTTSGRGTAASQFAFALVNQSTLPSTVEIRRVGLDGGIELVATQTLTSGLDPIARGRAVIAVPWQSITPAADYTTTSRSGRAPFAYRITTSRPVAAWQLNLQSAFRFTSRTCTDAEGSTSTTCNEDPEASDGLCKTPTGQTGRRCAYPSYTNDGSLLLPVSALGTRYHALVAEPARLTQTGSAALDVGSFSIVATEDGTVVEVTASSSNHASGGVPGLDAGVPTRFTLDAYEILQVASRRDGGLFDCKASLFPGQTACRAEGDLSGSRIESVPGTLPDGGIKAAAPIAVFSGSPCAISPHASVACDHIEEMIFPDTAGAAEFVAIRSAPVRQTGGALSTTAQASSDRYKIVASCDVAGCPAGISVTVTPASAVTSVDTRIGGGPACDLGTALDAGNCVLSPGRHLTFASRSSFVVNTTGPATIAQLLSGQSETGGSPNQGDPSLILLPPFSRWRSSTILSTPVSVPDNYVSIAVRSPDVTQVVIDEGLGGVTLDVATFTAIPGTNYRFTQRPITGGAHRLRAVGPNPKLGVTVHGYDQYVSYGYPAP